MNRFIATKQYKQFAEFCRACERDNYIGLCFGSAGVGKTESARNYSKWYQFMKYREYIHKVICCKDKFPVSRLKTVLYTPSQLNTPKETAREIQDIRHDFGLLKEKVIYGSNIPLEVRNTFKAKMIIIDEAERLKPQTLEIIREIYDTGKTNFILIGMPGIEKTLSWQPQLYSRIGFIHEFKNMSSSELKFILEKHLKKLHAGTLQYDDYTDTEVISTILRITNGNFRLVDSLIKQSIRIMKVNCMITITKEIVEAARSCLLIGQK